MRDRLLSRRDCICSSYAHLEGGDFYKLYDRVLLTLRANEGITGEERQAVKELARAMEKIMVLHRERFPNPEED